MDVPVQTEDAPPTTKTTEVGKEQRRRRSSFAAIASRAPPRPSSISVSLSQKMLPMSVAPCDYHKHLMPDLPGPIKMRQLLLWAVQRAGARQKNPKVQGMVEETVQALFSNKINTSWYQRPATAGTKSGPKNQELADCIQLYERYSERLKQELAEWQQLQQKVTEIPKTDLEFTPEYPLNDRPIRENLKLLGQWFDTLSSAVPLSIDLILVGSTALELVRDNQFRGTRPDILRRRIPSNKGASVWKSPSSPYDASQGTLHCISELVAFLCNKMWHIY